MESETDASLTVPLVTPLLKAAMDAAAAAAAAASSAVPETADEEWRVAGGRKQQRKKKSSAMRKREKARSGATPAAGVETAGRTQERVRPGALTPRRSESDLVVPATAFDGRGGPSRRVQLEQVVTRAEQLASELRSEIMEPVNKVAKSVASYIEERWSGIMSLLVAVTGKV